MKFSCLFTHIINLFINFQADKVSVWLNESVKDRAIMAIGYAIKSRLRLDDRDLVFESHQDSMNRNSSTVKAKFYV